VKGRIFLWAEAVEAEALITARTIRAVTHIPADLQDLLTGLPVLHTDHQVHLTDRLIRIIRADLIIPAIIPV